MPDSVPKRRRRGVDRSVDRLINFSDAVVAVAITLMALPLVDASRESDGETALQVMGDQWFQILTFLFTFYIVAIMWLAHNRILNIIVDYDPILFWLNTTWLAAIVLLPWVSAMTGDASRTRGGTGMVYWGTMALIAFLGWMMGVHIDRRPDLQDEPAERVYRADPHTRLRGPVFTGYFLLTGLTSIVLPSVASYMPLGIIPLSIWLRPARQDSHTTSKES